MSGVVRPSFAILLVAYVLLVDASRIMKRQLPDQCRGQDEPLELPESMIDEIQSAQDEAESASARADKALADHKKEMDAAEEAEQDLIQKRKEAKDKQADAEKAMRDAQDAEADYQDQLDDKKKAQREKLAKNKELQEATQDLKEAQDLLDAATKAFNEKRDKLVGFQDKCRKTIDGIIDEIDESEGRRKKAEEASAASRQRAQDKMAEAERLRIRAAQLDREALMEMASMAESDRVIREEKSLLDEKHADLDIEKVKCAKDKIDAQRKSIEEELERAKAALRKARALLAEKTGEFKEANAAFLQEEAELMDLAQQLADAAAKKDKLQAELEAIKETVAQLQLEIAQAETKAARLKKDYEKAQTEAELFKTLLDGLDALKAAIKAFYAEFAGLRATIGTPDDEHYWKHKNKFVKIMKMAPCFEAFNEVINIGNALVADQTRTIHKERLQKVLQKVRITGNCETKSACVWYREAIHKKDKEKPKCIRLFEIAHLTPADDETIGALF